MSMVVAHNIPAINANKNLYTSNNGLNSSLAKLSSGYRINVGADGPADLVSSEQLRAQGVGLERAVRNTTESMNVLAIAEGAMNEMNSILKKMKSLAIHAANNGITSPDQVAADQAEMDSSIQTLERIANTTKFSDQFLLNGAKTITYSVDTGIKGTQNNQLVNTGLSDFTQIFKRDGYSVSIGFNGTSSANSTTALGNAAFNRQAAKAYFEVDAYEGSLSQVNKDGYLTKGQTFILTGTLGARQFNFSEGAHVGTVVSAIHNVAGSTGVDAALIFNRNQQINMSAGAAKASCVGMAQTAGIANMVIYENYTTHADGSKHIIATDAAIKSGCVVYGHNTDGNGNIFVKIVGCGASASYELYKDASLSKESLIGTGIGNGSNSVIRNNSGLSLALNIADGRYGDVLRISVGNIALNANNVSTSGSAGCFFKSTESTASGVQLGINTDMNGKIYVKTVYDANGTKAMVYAYNNSLMREQDMVAKTYESVNMTVGLGNSIVLDSIWNDEKTANTGLGITLSLACAAWASGDQCKSKSFTMDIQFSNLAARIFSSEYGSDQFIKLQQFEGGLFTYYDDKANYESARLVEKNTTFEMRGQDATITVNGQQMKTRGLNLDLATPDVMADVTFNSGHTGTTTLAQVGYAEGTIFSKATSLTLGYALDETGNLYLDKLRNTGNNKYYSGLLNNACHVTNENISNFQGGMQLQLGEGSGDQERTVIGLKSMSTAQLGRMEVYGQFDKSKAVWETKTLSIQDVMGGQIADLSRDPALAMKIIEKAIADVSDNRALIGSVQANMLQTNENNLRVAIENVTKTESAIRDTDMAAEMTEFTKDQILSNAGISMLSQANQQAQSVLQLLQ